MVQRLYIFGSETRLGAKILHRLKHAREGEWVWPKVSSPHQSSPQIHLIGQCMAKLQCLNERYAPLVDSISTQDFTHKAAFYDFFRQITNGHSNKNSNQKEKKPMLLWLTGFENHLFDDMSVRATWKKREQMERSLYEALLEAKSLQDQVQLVKVSTCAPMIMEHANYAIPSARAHWELEEVILKEKLSSFKDYCILRPSKSMQCLLHDELYDMICARTLSLPIRPETSMLWIHEEDIVDAVMACMQGLEADDDVDVDVDAKEVSSPPRTKMQQQRWNLTGKDPLTWAEMTVLMSGALDGNHSLRYSQLPTWVLQPSMWIQGRTPDEIQAKIALAKYYDSQVGVQVTTALKTLTGQTPRSFASFLEENHAIWPISAI